MGDTLSIGCVQLSASTGEAETIERAGQLVARAVESQVYVAGCNQVGSHPEGKASYGRSMIIDPWGVVLAVAPDEDRVITAQLDRARTGRVRQQLPALANRRPAEA
ncbi:MAG: nitrilase-related carbon-nitrogen hydrolase [Gaiellales bacterium]